MDTGGIDPSQLPDATGWGPYAIFVASIGVVVMIFKQAKEWFGGKEKAAPEGTGEVKAILTGISDTLKRQDEAFSQHRKESRENDNAIFKKLDALHDDVSDVRERTAKLEGQRDVWTEQERQQRRGARA